MQFINLSAVIRFLTYRRVSSRSDCLSETKSVESANTIHISFESITTTKAEISSLSAMSVRFDVSLIYYYVWGKNASNACRMNTTCIGIDIYYLIFIKTTYGTACATYFCTVISNAFKSMVVLYNSATSYRKNIKEI